MATVLGADEDVTTLRRERAGTATGCWQRTLTLAVVAAILLQTARLEAQDATPDLPTEPILTIETGKHVAAIRRIDTDAANRFVVTASEDKTARVWSLSDGRLVRVLRLPIGPGEIGRAFAVAVSPDGTTVAVGGWTEPGGHAQSIFLFDRASGEIKQRLADVTATVNHLAYSPDGRRLAASLWGANGIRVFDTGSGYTLLPSDTQYGDQSESTSFDPWGRLVTTSFDGSVRLYAADHYDKPIARFDSRAHKPYSAAFSPDGSRVAVGYNDASVVSVLSGKDLEQLFDANTTGIPNVGLCAVGWSQDGRSLFAGGYWSVNNVWQIRRWSDGGIGAFVDFPSAPDTIMQILAAKEDRTLFASLQNFGVIEANAKPSQLQGFGALRLNSGRGPLLVTKNGDTVEVNSWGPFHTYRFALSRRQVDVDPATDASLMAPTTATPGLTIANWYNLIPNPAVPTVNGMPLKLKPYETARSVAVVPAAKHFVLGTEWSLRLFGEDGHEVWPARPVPGMAWNVNVTGDGRLIVAALGDGTIRWYRLSDGQEILALFINPDGQRWILWTPQGYYDASTTMPRLAPTS
jgi:WD40 repeat protein